MQQHIQALIHCQHGQVQAIVQLHQLLGTCGEGGVHLHLGAVAELIGLGLGHLTQSSLNAHILVFVVGVNFETVNGLQKLGFLVQQLLQHELLLLFGQTGVHDLVRFLQPPGLQLIVQDLKVSCGARVHPALDLRLAMLVCSSLCLGLLLSQEGLPLHLCIVQVGSSLAPKPAPGPALNKANRSIYNLHPFLTGLVPPRHALHIIAGIQHQPRALHLRCSLPICLCCVVLDSYSLGSPLQLGLHSQVARCFGSLSYCMVKHSAAELVAVASQVGLRISLSVIHEHSQQAVWKAWALSHFHINEPESWCDVTRGLCRLHLAACCCLCLGCICCSTPFPTHGPMLQLGCCA
mmetsp:Transcript_27723/g.75006  ORF Transcript_27723/g.75006 Transcript_27723/m.75006 type:complete len:349 (-) Transcript_27723:990-2036(-)